MTVYGDIGNFIDRRQIEEGTTKHLQDWLQPYLEGVERFYTDIPEGSLKPPRSWRLLTDLLSRSPEDTLPMIAVISPGRNTAKPLRMDGDGQVTGWWVVAIGAVVAAGMPEDARNLSGYYGAAIRLAMMQNPDMGGWANGVTCDDESYDDLPVIEEAQLAAVRLVFTIEVPGTADLYAGFTGLPDQPYAAEDTEFTVGKGKASVDLSLTPQQED